MTKIINRILIAISIMTMSLNAEVLEIERCAGHQSSPYCGGTDIVFEINPELGCAENPIILRCKKCGCFGWVHPEVVFSYETLVKEWNNRHSKRKKEKLADQKHQEEIQKIFSNQQPTLKVKENE